MSNITPFLMFEGNAEEAMHTYISLIEDSSITNITRFGPEGPGIEGKVMQASFTLKGQTFMCIDSYIKHEFTFTPAFSIFVNCDTEDEVNRLYDGLSAGGSVLMPLGNYGFSRQFGWINDTFGVSWQINLP
ncbi:Glyoxalase superfamily enzyme, possibly 3-demethylubiquinone-9 3-methyltransferase [Paenibacillaceae bacterium GAS479]|nr:Glyoxalase superfamily enzyme, possibly 3-demethylubiquinone-9 3-methyltransferase [Paenibacillaceae bacterium GAS479]